MAALAAVVGSVRADEPAEPNYVESIVAPASPSEALSNEAVFAPPQGCWMKSLEEDPAYYLTAFGGASYFDTGTRGLDPGKTSLGGAYGASLYVPVCGALGTMVRGRANHYDGGSQYSGTLGVFKGSQGEGEFASRLGWTIGVDQFTDTGLGSPYLVRGQYIVDYAFTRTFRVGMRYLDPLHGDEGNSRVTVPVASETVPLWSAELVEATIAVGPSIMDQFVFGVGYCDDYESTTFRVAAVQPLSERLSASFNAFYDEGLGLWSGFLGVQVDISPCRIRNRWVASRTTPSEVVRGEASAAFSTAISLREPFDGTNLLSSTYDDGTVEPANNVEVGTGTPGGGGQGPGGGGGGGTEENPGPG